MVSLKNRLMSPKASESCPKTLGKQNDLRIARNSLAVAGAVVVGDDAVAAAVVACWSGHANAAAGEGPAGVAAAAKH